MADFTDFAGLERLVPGDPLDAGFLTRNPTIIDALLKIGAVTHRHDGHARLVDPVTAPTVTPSNVGGTIPSDTPIYVGYTFIDSDGGETLMSDAEQVSTDPGLPDPTDAPDLASDNVAGTLLADTYYYAVTVIDGLGGETMIGPANDITIDPGFPNAQVTVSGLDTIMADVGGTGWRLWRAVGAGAWHMLATGAGASVVDDGSFHGDCDVIPPTTPQTNKTNQVTVSVAGPAPAGAISFNLYLSTDGSFEDPALVANHLVADLDTDIVLTALTTIPGAPPAVSLTLPGATRIDPDTEMLDFPWKRPVADAAALPAVGNENGDIRETLDDHALHTWDGAAWVDLAGGGGGGGGTPLYPMDQPVGWVKNGETVVLLRPDEATFFEIIMDEPFDEAAGSVGDNYASDGAGSGIPAAGGNNTDAIHYPGLGTMLDGKVERDFTINTLNWTRAGVTIGHGRRGLFAWVTATGNLIIAWRDVDTGAEGDYTVLATEPLPDAPTGGEFWNLELERVDNHLHAFVHSGKVVIAEAEADIPLALRAEFGAGQVLGAGLADRWSNPDAWSIDFVRATAYHRRRELWADVKTEFGTTISRRLLRDDGGSVQVLFGDMTAAYSAGWMDDALTAARYLIDDDHEVKLQGRAVKVSGTAPALDDVITTLDVGVIPLTEQVVPVATGDVDGLQLGMVRIDTSGVITWLDGRSSLPSAKSPYVSFDGISYQTA